MYLWIQIIIGNFIIRIFADKTRERSIVYALLWGK